MIKFIAGTMVGGFLGIMLMALLFINEYEETYRKAELWEEYLDEKNSGY